MCANRASAIVVKNVFYGACCANGGSDAAIINIHACKEYLGKLRTTFMQSVSSAVSVCINANKSVLIRIYIKHANG